MELESSLMIRPQKIMKLRVKRTRMASSAKATKTLKDNTTIRTTLLGSKYSTSLLINRSTSARQRKKLSVSREFKKLKELDIQLSFLKKAKKELSTSTRKMRRWKLPRTRIYLQSMTPSCGK